MRPLFAIIVAATATISATSASAACRYMQLTGPSETLCVSHAAVESAAASPDGKFVYVSFAPNARMAFAEFTGHNVGQRVSLSLCGHVIQSAVLQSVITTGALAIPSAPTRDIKDVLGALQSGRCN